jgi:hypothetical protein
MRGILHGVAIAAGMALALTGVVPAGAVEADEIIARSYRVSEMRGVDRVVFSFRGGPPGWHAEYVRAEHADASGFPVPLEGHAFLNITFSPAHASEPGSSRPTAAERTATPRLAILRQVKPAGDFEGYVSFGLGLSRHARYHLFALHNPDRIVLDLR